MSLTLTRLRTSWPVYAALLLSGAASLVYQVAWTRRLSGVTRASHPAIACSTCPGLPRLAPGNHWPASRQMGYARSSRAYPS